MNFKRGAGKIFGVQFNKKEQAALDLEISRQIAEHERQHEVELDELLLYFLHAHLGFGKKRLRRAFLAFDAEFQKLVDHYEMPDSNAWLAGNELKKIGVDVEAWVKERNEGSAVTQ